MLKIIFLVIVGFICIFGSPVKREIEFSTEYIQEPESTSVNIDQSSTSSTIFPEDEETNTEIDDYNEERNAEVAIEIIRETIEDILNKINDAISNDEFANIVDELNTIVDRVFNDNILESK